MAIQFWYNYVIGTRYVYVTRCVWWGNLYKLLKKVNKAVDVDVKSNVGCVFSESKRHTNTYATSTNMNMNKEHRRHNQKYTRAKTIG